MNSIVSSVRCRLLRYPLESTLLRRKSQQPWPQKNHSMNCVRLASTKTKSGILSRLRNIFYDNSVLVSRSVICPNAPTDERTSMSPRARSVMDLAPRESQPPIREPNMPEKQNRKDDKKDQKDKKPVIKTLPKNEPAYKYQWGVRVPDLNPDPVNVEQSPTYVVTHKWGVNINNNKEPEKTPSIDTTPKSINPQSIFKKSVETIIKNIQTVGTVSQINQSEIKDLSTASTIERTETSIAQSQTAQPVSQISQSKIEKLASTASSSELPETSIAQSQTAQPVSQISQSKIQKLTLTASSSERPETSIAQPQTAQSVSQIFQSKSENLSSTASTLDSAQNSPSIVSAADAKIASRSPRPAASSGVDLTSGTIVPGDDDYNVPTEIPHGSEISAWRDVVVRSKLHEDELARAAAIDLVGDPAESIFIRPEPPQPKLDVRVVGAAGDVVSPQENVAKPSELSSNTSAMNFATTKKFHTCAIACRRLAMACHRNMLANFSSMSSDDGRDLRSSSGESEEPSTIETLATDKTKEIRASQIIHDGPKFEEDMSSVLQDLSQREMEVLLSYTRHNSEEAGTSPTLPTSVTISTFPTGSNENDSEKKLHDGNEIFNSETIDANSEITELERTILKFKDGDDNEDGKEIKDKKGKKEEDYIRIPGDPYPYSREHYEKWRVPHGKCPIVNDDVPKAKPVETSDSPRLTLNPDSAGNCMIADKRTSKIATSPSPDENRSSSVSRKESNRKSSGSTRVTAVGAEQPTDRVKTIHPDIEPSKRDVVDDSASKDQVSELVENLKSIDIKTSAPIGSDVTPEDLESIKQRRRRAGDDKAEAARVYELKNYAYIRPDYIKDNRGPLIPTKKLNDQSAVESAR